MASIPTHGQLARPSPRPIQPGWKLLTFVRIVQAPVAARPWRLHSCVSRHRRPSEAAKTFSRNSAAPRRRTTQAPQRQRQPPGRIGRVLPIPLWGSAAEVRRGHSRFFCAEGRRGRFALPGSQTPGIHQLLSPLALGTSSASHRARPAPRRQHATACDGPLERRFPRHSCVAGSSRIRIWRVHVMANTADVSMKHGPGTRQVSFLPKRIPLLPSLSVRSARQPDMGGLGASGSDRCFGRGVCVMALRGWKGGAAAARRRRLRNEAATWGKRRAPWEAFRPGLRPGHSTSYGENFPGRKE